jgi:hypothetical protein
MRVSVEHSVGIGHDRRARRQRPVLGEPADVAPVRVEETAHVGEQ